jgi:isoleucyl-tRNA synthetase
VQHAVVPEEMLPLDQYMVLLTADLTERVRRWYEGFEFHRIYQQINEFCTVDLSAVYFDVLKDRLYTSAPNSRARRSAQTAVWKIGEALVRLVAPIMSFTADEIWPLLPKMGTRPESVHLAYFPHAEDVAGNAATLSHLQARRADFDALMAVRNEALKTLEVARQEKLIRSALEAVVTFYAPESLYQLMERYRNDLRFLLIVSGVELKPAAEGNGNAPLRVEVSKAPGQKCERCWNYSTHVGESERYPTVCERCLEALKEIEQEACLAK